MKGLFSSLHAATNSGGPIVNTEATKKRVGKWLAIVTGIVFLIVGGVVGTLQLFVIYAFYKAGTRNTGVIDLYLCGLFWSAWIAISFGYVASGHLVENRPKIAMVLIGACALAHAAAIWLISWIVNG